MTESDVRAALNGQRAQLLLSIWDRAWTQYISDGQMRHPRARAAVLWDNALKLADAELVALPGVERRGNDELPAYVFDDKVAVHFKKTDRRMRTAGYPTIARKRRLDSGSLEGMPGLLPITCGYTLDKAEAGIAAYPIVRTIGRKPEWDFDLREILEPGEGLEPTAPIFPLDPTQPTLPSIRPAAKQGDGEEPE